MKRHKKNQIQIPKKKFIYPIIEHSVSRVKLLLTEKINEKKFKVEKNSRISQKSVIIIEFRCETTSNR